MRSRKRGGTGSRCAGFSYGHVRIFGGLPWPKLSSACFFFLSPVIVSDRHSVAWIHWAFCTGVDLCLFVGYDKNTRWNREVGVLVLVSWFCFTFLKVTNLFYYHYPRLQLRLSARFEVLVVAALGTVNGEPPGKARNILLLQYLYLPILLLC